MKHNEINSHSLCSRYPEKVVAELVELYAKGSYYERDAYDINAYITTSGWEIPMGENVYIFEMNNGDTYYLSEEEYYDL